MIQKKVVIISDISTKLNLDNISNIEELGGDLAKSDEQKLMSSIIEGDKETLDESKLINESINQGLNSFTPDAIFENLVKDYRDYRKGDRYKDLALKRTIRKTVRRGHKKIKKEDLSVFEREARGKVYIVYALDSSGSMKGSKIDLCKKAGIALAYQAINENDKIGLLVFGSQISNEIRPTSDFEYILKEITKISPRKETDIASTILRSIELFPDEEVTKHLIIITDGMPTIGDEPEKETLNATSIARYAGITVSVIGINLNEEGEKLARDIVQIGDGKLYIVKNLENLDSIVLEDYYSLI